jgi:hypothetical protein
MWSLELSLIFYVHEYRKYCVHEYSFVFDVQCPFIFSLSYVTVISDQYINVRALGILLPVAFYTLKLIRLFQNE